MTHFLRWLGVALVVLIVVAWDDILRWLGVRKPIEANRERLTAIVPVTPIDSEKQSSPIKPVQITADEFCSGLAALMPSVESFAAAGLDSNSAETLREMWYCERTSSADTEDPLLDLCSNFDMKSAQIRDVAFCNPEDAGGKPYHFNSDYLVVGWDEGYPILYRKQEGLVELVDYPDMSRGLGRCARSPQGFLKALLIANEYITSTVHFGGVRNEFEPSIAQEALDSCLDYAGRECEDFYRGLMNIPYEVKSGNNDISR